MAGFLGITNTTNITAEQINNLINVSDYGQMAINVNNIYAGYLYFIMLCVLAAIMLYGLFKITNEPLPSALAVFFVVSVIGFYLRAAQLLTDKLVWFFPSLVIIALAVMYATKN